MWKWYDSHITKIETETPPTNEAGLASSRPTEPPRPATSTGPAAQPATATPEHSAQTTPTPTPPRPQPRSPLAPLSPSSLSSLRHSVTPSLLLPLPRLLLPHLLRVLGHLADLAAVGRTIQRGPGARPCCDPVRRRLL